MDRVGLLRRLAEVLEARRYLEIGVWEGRTFSALAGLVSERVGVDPRGSPATHRMTSDVYFAGLADDEAFDLVFVDGLHERAQVVRDVTNALRHLSPGGVVVVHDCNPPDEPSARPATTDEEAQTFQASTWCGDVWRGWLDLRATLDRPLLVYGPDLGCGIVLPVGAAPLRPIEAGEDGSMTWEAFDAARDRLLPIASPEELEAALVALRQNSDG